MYIVLPNAGALIFLRNPKEQMAWGHDGVWRRVQNGAIRGISHFFFYIQLDAQRSIGTPRRPGLPWRFRKTSLYFLLYGLPCRFFLFFKSVRIFVALSWLRIPINRLCLMHILKIASTCTYKLHQLTEHQPRPPQHRLRDSCAQLSSMQPHDPLHRRVNGMLIVCIAALPENCSSSGALL